VEVVTCCNVSILPWPVSQAKRRSLWARVLNCPILVLVVVPPAVTSDWKWQMGCLLTGAILWLIMVLVLLRIRFTGADKAEPRTVRYDDFEFRV
jgi:hypothetical protein